MEVDLASLVACVETTSLFIQPASDGSNMLVADVLKCAISRVQGYALLTAACINAPSTMEDTNIKVRN